MYTQFNRCLNKEVKYYGLSYLGLLGAMFIGGIIWLKFSMAIGLLGGAIGYGFTAQIAKYWHLGAIQRWLYWYLPIFRTKYLPRAYQRCLV